MSLVTLGLLDPREKLDLPDQPESLDPQEQRDLPEYLELGV